MSVVADKLAEALALPMSDRAFLAHQLLASLDPHQDLDTETQWQEVVDRRTKEIEEGKVNCLPISGVLDDIRAKLNAHRHAS